VSHHFNRMALIIRRSSTLGPQLMHRVVSAQVHERTSADIMLAVHQKCLGDITRQSYGKELCVVDAAKQRRKRVVRSK
jgi:hypothetical protein